MRTLANAFALSLVLAGCGSENNANNNAATNNAATNNAATNNAATNNTSTNNVASNNASTNNVAANNTTVNPRTEPYFTQFTYYVEDENALGTNREGFTVSVISGEISNEGGNSSFLTAEDLATFEEAHLAASTMMKMRDGWGCRIVVDGGDMGTSAGDMGTGDMGTADSGPVFVDEANYWFEARIQDGGSSREIQEITGCVLDADPAVMTIIDALADLGQRYL